MTEQTPKQLSETQRMIAEECDAIKALLLAKNQAYGNSATEPLRIMSKASPVEQILVRLDDKLSRIARGDGSGNEDAEQDLLGYLVLLRVARKQQASVCTCDEDDGCTCDGDRDKIPDPTVPEPKLPADYGQAFKGASVGYGPPGPPKPAPAGFDANGSPVEIPSANQQLRMEGKKAAKFPKSKDFCVHVGCYRERAASPANYELCVTCKQGRGLSCSMCWGGL